MIFYEDGKRVRYNPYNMKRDEQIGTGMEIDAYRKNDQVIKFYKDYCSKIRMDKKTCEFLEKIHTKRILLPTKTLLNKHHQMRAYKMLYIEDLGIESFYLLNKEDLVSEMILLHNDIKLLSDYHILIEDLTTDNTIYHNGIYFIDPGSYKKCEDKSLDSNIIYGMNMDVINEYLLSKIFRRCCLYLSNNYHEINFVMELIKQEIRDKELNELTFLIEGMESSCILEFVKNKFVDAKDNVCIDKKQIHLKENCRKIYSDYQVEIYDYLDQQEVKQLYIYKPSYLKLGLKQIKKISGMHTQRILVPTNTASVFRDNCKGIIIQRKRNHQDHFHSLSGKQISLEFDDLIRDAEQLSQQGIYIGTITKDDMIYDEGIYINNIEEFEWCDNPEQARKRNINSMNDFVLSLIQDELTNICSPLQKEEIINSILTSTVTYVSNTIYAELYQAKSFKDCAKKLLKTRSVSGR